MGKSGVLQHKSSNISETRKDKGTVTMKLTNAFSNGTNADPYGLLFPNIGGCNPKTSIAIISGTGKATNFKFLYAHS